MVSDSPADLLGGPRVRICRLFFALLMGSFMSLVANSTRATSFDLHPWRGRTRNALTVHARGFPSSGFAVVDLRDIGRARAYDL